MCFGRSTQEKKLGYACCTDKISNRRPIYFLSTVIFPTTTEMYFHREIIPFFYEVAIVRSMLLKFELQGLVEDVSIYLTTPSEGNHLLQLPQHLHGEQMSVPH